MSSRSEIEEVKMGGVKENNNVFIYLFIYAVFYLSVNVCPGIK